ncbi:MAG: hypothetical protein LBO75_02625, partial [Bifidobacteriaceae bacterium]|nr:hypothetical protein [Bifidobacteriaceae bacterium]
LRRRRRRWLVLSFGLLASLYVAAASGLTWLEPITGLWYSDRSRLGPLLTVVGIPLVLQGLGWVLGVRKTPQTRSWGLPGWVAVVTVIGLVTAVGLTVVRPFRLHATYYRVPVSSPAGADRFFDQAELAMLQRLGTELDRNGMVLGDPANGSAFLYSLNGQPVVFPHLSGSWDQPRRYLREHFGDLGRDPAVCQAVNKLGVKYFYLDSETWYGDSSFAAMTQGLQREGNLELIDQGGTAAVYRITACGDA